MGVSLEYATLSQIAIELRRRANRERAKLTSSSTSTWYRSIRFDLPERLDKMAKELESLGDE